MQYVAQLTTAALNHSQDMVNRGYFDHVAPAPAPNGASPGERVANAGYQWTAVAENIAQGQTTEAEVFQAWMNSQGHRENMLNPAYNQIGLGLVGNTWTLKLASGRGTGAAQGVQPNNAVQQQPAANNQQAAPAPAQQQPAANNQAGNPTAFLDLINAARAQNGAGPVAFNPQLTTAAVNHSQDMVNRNYFDHTAPAPAPNGAELGQRVTAAGYQWTGVAENIAQGQTTEAEVFQSWMNSPGHRANMLNATYTQIGLGRVGNTWTLVLASQ